MKPTCALHKTITKDGKEAVVCDQTRSQLMPLLEEIQDAKGYISDRDMQEIADRLGIHPVEVYSVVTFYSFFSYKKKGRHTIRIGNCISDVMAGNDKVIKAFEKELKIKPGQTTKDGKFTVEMTGCIGMCDQAPAMMVDGELIGKVTPAVVKKLVKTLKSVKRKA